tara:strand:- start:742 stop:1233 length:492 start_codon:yes stop_codon:yes gene_type:complete
MEATPKFVLPPRPTPPEPNTKEHDRWCREEAIVYEGGSFTTAYGNLVQTWGAGELPAAHIPTNVDRKQYTATRTNKIGGDSQQVNVPASTYKKYPGKNGGNAAAGELFTVDSDDGIFTARVTGDIQLLIAWIVTHRMQQYQGFTLYSGRGKQYGPFTPITITP